MIFGYFLQVSREIRMLYLIVLFGKSEYEREYLEIHFITKR